MTPQRAATELEPTRWVLASASPRRQELLSAAAQSFEVVPSRAAELPLPGESGESRSRRLALEKAIEVARRLPGRWVLGADTLVLCEGAILGKPAHAADARHMLRGLSGRHHRVVTAFVLVAPDGSIAEDALIETRVGFRALSERDLENYVASNEWQDKAGGYAIQGAAGAFVSELRGSHSNVVGLPMEAVEQALRSHGLWRDGSA